LTENLKDVLSAKGYDFVSLNNILNEPADGDLLHSGWLGTSQNVDARDTIHALAGQAWDWLVVDHYSLDIRWESALRPVASKILVIDDLADRQHDCEVLLDQNLYSHMSRRYVGKVPEQCQLLLGPRYALLREEFGRLRPQVKPRCGPFKRVLVFFGGVDADNYTSRAIDALVSIGMSDLHVDVVIGSLHPCRDEINAKCVRHGLCCHVQTDRMAELMAYADWAIGAGGSASWERCCLGLPTYATCLADNQRDLLQDAAVNGLLYAPLSCSGDHEYFVLHLRALMGNPALLQSMSRQGMEAVDGRGVQRVLRAIGSVSLVIREARVADSANMFEWRNHESIRAVSRKTRLIEQSEHDAWFTAAIADESRILLIAEQRKQPVGVVRFDISGDRAEVSIFLVPGAELTGAGGDLLCAAEQWLVKQRPDVLSICAEVLSNNESSHQLFKSAGFQLKSTTYMKKVQI
jgi:UDP-2,4-diacetamido-2,4,6-trideoxy-beta-L-altropyranose hydrolase